MSTDVMCLDESGMVVGAIRAGERVGSGCRQAMPGLEHEGTPCMPRLVSSRICQVASADLSGGKCRIEPLVMLRVLCG